MPLDVSYPQPLLDSILEDSKPAAVLTVKDLQLNVKGMYRLTICQSHIIVATFKGSCVVKDMRYSDVHKSLKDHTLPSCYGSLKSNF